MSHYKLIDTFPEFMSFWDTAKGEPLDTQLELWLTEYMARWPELLEKQLKDYASDGLDWKTVAREHVFPFLPERLPLMMEAREELLTSAGIAYQSARENLGLDFDVSFVIYVGIGCGAGWATSFQKVPAVLLGLENIAELGWTKGETLIALAAHELGHLIHQHWRRVHGVPSGSGAFWQLYEEGFAQRCEHIISGCYTWHEQGQDADWLIWCDSNKAWLAREFWRRVKEGEEVDSFFGSWYNIRGHIQTGYFLGHEIIRAWEGKMPLKDIAVWPPEEVQEKVGTSLKELAGMQETQEA